MVDNFERGLATVPEDAKETPFAEGMEKIYKQLMKTLDDMGVKPSKLWASRLIPISIMQ